MTNTLKKLQDFSTKLNSNRFFEFFVVSIIIFSALVVGVKTYNISDEFLSFIGLLDWTITIIFLVEITIRFIAEPRKSQFFKKAWNVFDTLIVVVGRSRYRGVCRKWLCHNLV